VSPLHPLGGDVAADHPGHVFQKFAVGAGEGGSRVAIDIDLAHHLPGNKNRCYDFRPRIDRTREVPRVRMDVIHNNCGSRSNRGSTDTLGMETFHTLKQVLKAKKYSTAVGDEGGFAPDLKSNDEAVELILEAITKAGYKPSEDISICLDPAASEMWEDGKYILFKSTKKAITSDELVRLWESWAKQYPIVLLEDGMGENDWDGWRNLTVALGSKIELVGDDVFCTNPQILQQGIDKGIGNAVLIKLNQIGSVTETLDTMELAARNGYRCFVSHRSGETEDTFIADLTVATGAGHIKTGSGCRSERVAKFNQFLRIEERLKEQAKFAGRSAFRR